MTSSLARSDLALFPCPSAAPHSSPVDLLESARIDPYLPAQLDNRQLQFLVDHIRQFPRKGSEMILIQLRCLYQLKQWSEMISVSSTFLNRNKANVSVRQLRAQAYFEFQDWGAFILDCNRLIDEHHPDLQLLTKRCYAYYRCGMFHEMLQDVRKIKELSAQQQTRLESDLDPSNPETCLRAQAIIIRYFPNDLELRRNHARLLFYLQKWEQLLVACTMWQIWISPTRDPELVRLKLHACVCLKYWSLVISETTQILNHYPEDVSMLALRARAHAMHGDFLHSLRDNLARNALDT